MQGRAKRRRKEIMDKEKVYVGIDIAKERIDVAVHSSEQRWSFSNDDVGITRAVSCISGVCPVLVCWKPRGTFRRPW